MGIFFLSYQNKEKRITTLHSVCRDLTFAGLQAFGPRVLEVTAVSTVFEPSAARSATTGSTGFFERAALRAR